MDLGVDLYKLRVVAKDHFPSVSAIYGDAVAKYGQVRSALDGAMTRPTISAAARWGRCMRLGPPCTVPRQPWVPRDAVGHSFSPVTATYLRTARFNPRIPTSVDIHYKETSANCRSLDNRITAVVFRDATGKVVGGGIASPDTPIIFWDEQGNDLGGERQRPSSPSCSQGERESWIVPPTGGPATADDAWT